MCEEISKSSFNQPICGSTKLMERFTQHYCNVSKMENSKRLEKGNIIIIVLLYFAERNGVREGEVETRAQFS